MSHSYLPCHLLTRMVVSQLWNVRGLLPMNRIQALAKRKRERKKEREAAARLRSRVAMGMESHAIDLPEEEAVFSLATIKVCR